MRKNQKMQRFTSFLYLFAFLLPMVAPSQALGAQAQGLSFETKPLAKPVRGIAGVAPVGDIYVKGRPTVEFRIEFDGEPDVEKTTGRIRIIDEATREEIYSLEADDLRLDADTLSFAVPPELFQPERDYSIRADGNLVRLNTKPGSLGAIPEGAWSIHVRPGSVADEQIDEIKTFLASNPEPISDEAFVETEFYKQQMDVKTKRRLRRAHALALSAIDPNPAWQQTQLETRMIHGVQGAQYVLAVDKLDAEGNVIGHVSSIEMKPVVRIQRASGDFEYVPEFISREYAFISQGKLYINVPTDLWKGRLVVGLRPDLDDVGQKVLAERWSTFVTVEVWPTQPGVVEIDQSNVMFPASDEAPFHPELAFSQLEIRDVVASAFADIGFVLPLVVRDLEFAVGDLVDYRLGDSVYGGRVQRVVNKPGQQLVVLTPEWADVYDITEFKEDALVEQGVLPEFVVHRIGGAQSGFDEAYRSDLTHVGPDDRADIGARNNFQLGEIGGDSLAARSVSSSGLEFQGCNGTVNGSLVFTPVFGIDPIDVGLLLTAGVKGVKGECVWAADVGKGINLMRGTGIAGAALEKLFGTGVIAKPVGEIKASIESETELFTNVSVEAGWTYEEGPTTKNTLNLPEDVGSPLLGAKTKTQTFAGGALNFVIGLDAIKQDSYAGKVAEWLSINFDDVALEGKLEFESGLSVTAADAASVYAGEESSVGLKLGASAKIEASVGLVKMLDFVGIRGKLTLPEVKLEGEPFKGGSRFTGELGHDDGNGYASVRGLGPASEVLRTLFPSGPDGSLGWIAPEDQSSSVFEDPSAVITYDTIECESQDDRMIKAPVIACEGPYCGKTEEFAFCGGMLTATPVLAIGKVGDEVSGSSIIEYKADASVDPITVTVSHDLFPLKPSGFELTGGGYQSVEGKIICPQEGSIFGEVTARSTDGAQEVTEGSILICKKDGPEDHVWGSPHLTTTDGLAYDYYASGDYVLSRVPGLKGYEIQARFLPGYDVSWPQATAMQVGDDVVEIFADMFFPRNLYGSSRLRLYVNGSELFPAGQYHSTVNNRIVALPGGGRIVIDRTLARFQGLWVDPTAVYVTWPSDGTHAGHVAHVATYNLGEGEWVDHQDVPPILDISIERDDRFRGLEQGLLGNNDGNGDNDFVRRNGQVLDATSTPLSWTALYALFGGDWLVRPQECLFTRGCLEPQFPATPEVLSTQQRITAEIACDGLDGWYFDACVHDVGLTGETVLVHEYYGDTEDLNHLADLITQPSPEVGIYQATFGPRVDHADSTPGIPVYSRNVTLELLSGNGDYLLIARPPRGANVSFAEGESSLTGFGDLETAFTLDCRSPDPDWEPLGEAWPEQGQVQLWTVDGLSGSADNLIDALSLNCAGSQTPGFAANLNDTGVTQCYSPGTGGMVECPAADLQGQDGDHGRDSLALSGKLQKIGSGPAGFDFTRVSESGDALDETADEWSCVTDNVTGLTWERKNVDPDSLHYAHHLFIWYSTDVTSNGGNAGLEDYVTSHCTDEMKPCNTEQFVDLVNETALCGYTDWRMPTVEELMSIRMITQERYAVDPVLFPEPMPEMTNHHGFLPAFWTNESISVIGTSASQAWAINFDNGFVTDSRFIIFGKGKGFEAAPVRLVRGGRDGVDREGR